MLCSVPAFVALDGDAGVVVGAADDVMNDLVDDPEEYVAVELTSLERDILSIGLTDWSQFYSGGDSMVKVLGFRNVVHFGIESQRIAKAIRDGEALTRRDWTTALATLEIMLSEVLGSGEWGPVHGYDEDELHLALLPLRRKLPASRRYLRR